MYKDLEAKNFDTNNIKGLSQRQLEEHLKLYKGYVSKVNEISKLSKDAKDFPGSNPTFSKMRSEKVAETFALDGVILHELYFENISSNTRAKCVAYGDMIKLIDEQYSNFENFMAYFKQVALSVRGWAIVTIDSLTNQLRVIGADAHDHGAVWCAAPLAVIDVYEHAYFIDFGTDRAKYLDTVLDDINWEVVERRLQQYKQIKKISY
ncbi:superoxide dismutase [Clostridium mediterraneense]|uniref:superoxide dismutase n=1 Tax=Clostridium mediterraneense TaxID=1805472 RepID=UPI000832CDC7|nr:Fe-Mn family superoxide dismutase [Clostridium mediterraneense]